MPTYEYKCLKCSHLFEVFQSMKSEPIKKCPACSGEVKRLFSVGAGAIFKGSGFYQTDYKNAPETPKKKVVEKTEKAKNSTESKTISKGTTDNK